MARSRKQRERKLKARLHEAHVQAAAIRKQLSVQNDSLVDYVGGVTGFGHEILDMISRTNFITHRDSEQFTEHVLTTARYLGFIERDPHASHRWILTHMCKQLMEGNDEPSKES